MLRNDQLVIQEIDTAVRAEGIRPLAPGDPLNEHLHPSSLIPVLRMAMAHLAWLGGAETSNAFTAGDVNRGLLLQLTAEHAADFPVELQASLPYAEWNDGLGGAK